ncbi:MAG: PEP-CTERM sorting domain-containing protein [Alphaproteobacteria bacterium]|nr:PEP-CTERM sorting domain-containing protein [Alphaproteobacteria bacterium]
MRFRLGNYSPIAALFGAAAITIGVAAPVHATPLLHAFIQNGSFGTVACSFSVGAGAPAGCNDLDALAGPVVAEATIGANPLFPQARGTSGATFGTLRNLAEGFSRASFSGNETVFANATFVIDDLIFTDLNETGATKVTTSLNVHVGGSIGGTINIPGGPNVQGTYSLSIFANGNNAVDSGLVKGDIIGTPIANTGMFGLTGTSSSVDDVFATNGFTFDLNTPQSLRLTAFAKASAVSGSLVDVEQGDLASLLEVNFGSTASFASTVFNLPDGFTANSRQAGITNNSFGVTTVPEPGMLSLFALGIAGVALLRGRRWPKRPVLP